MAFSAAYGPLTLLTSPQGTATISGGGEIDATSYGTQYDTAFITGGGEVAVTVVPLRSDAVLISGGGDIAALSLDETIPITYPNQIGTLSPRDFIFIGPIIPYSDPSLSIKFSVMDTDTSEVLIAIAIYDTPFHPQLAWVGRNITVLSQIFLNDASVGAVYGTNYSIAEGMAPSIAFHTNAGIEDLLSGQLDYSGGSTFKLALYLGTRLFTKDDAIYTDEGELAYNSYVAGGYTVTPTIVEDTTEGKITVSFSTISLPNPVTPRLGYSFTSCLLYSPSNGNRTIAVMDVGNSAIIYNTLDKTLVLSDLQIFTAGLA